MTDQWEALFRIWHGKHHDFDPELLKDLLALERRIVKLEAYVNARRIEESTRHEYEVR